MYSKQIATEFVWVIVFTGISVVELIDIWWDKILCHYPA